MSLKEYRKKRDFAKTSEPAGSRGKAAGWSFTVQKHRARRLHYDFRLELDGVLKSWAVPKGPSFDPRERRLAVEVEDHPVEYGVFEGTIPKGEYGAGTVLLWDRGRWKPKGDPREGLRSGRLKFDLEGSKLRGGWTLVRLAGSPEESKTNWLLIKEKDAEARPSSEFDVVALRPESVSRRKHGGVRRPKGRGRPPDFIEPQLALLVEKAPEGGGWIHEVKFDGYRILARLEGGRARLFTRRGNDWTAHFPALAAELGALGFDGWIDGELTVLDEKGVSSFQALQNALDLRQGDRLVYHAFDLLHHDGNDLRLRPLIERKELLASVLKVSDSVRYSDHVEGSGGAFHRKACEMGLEGAVAKLAAGVHRPGRSPDWRKIKCMKRQEFVIVGYTEPAGARSSFGALLLGVNKEKDGGELAYAGRVGTGFTERTLRELHARLKRLETASPPLSQPPSGAAARGVHWTKPRLVAEVAYSGWTNDGVLRQPSFQGLREDKPAHEVVLEKPAEPEPKDSVAGVRLTNPGRVLYPDQGVTKRHLALYYESISDWALPRLERRPLSLVRCPAGREKHCFFQKHLGPEAPAHLKGIEIDEKKETTVYSYLVDLKGLLSLVQLGVLEIHPWGSRVETLERPDRIIFDLDPAPKVAWERVVDAAGAVRERLKQLGLESFVKTTGGKGLHVVAPLAPRAEWPEVKAFAKAVVDSLAAERPREYTGRLAKKDRSGRIFIDYLRNGRGATGIGDYSTRAKPGATVSAPVAWSELTPALRSDQFNVFNLPERLSRLKKDPWAGFDRADQAIGGRALKELARWS